MPDKEKKEPVKDTEQEELRAAKKADMVVK